MSSHHIVRDEQEPALILVEVGAGSFELAGHLLGWAPLAVALPECLQEVLGWGIKLDAVVLPESDRLQREADLAAQQPLKVLSAGRVPIQDAVEWLVSKKVTAINVLGSYSPVNVPPAWLTAYSEINWTVYSPSYKGTLIRSGKYRKWQPEGSQVFVDQSVIWFGSQSGNSEVRQIELTDPDWVVFEVLRPTWVFERLALPDNGF